MKYRKDFVFGIILAAFSIFYIISASKIKIFTGPGAAPINARAIPYMWGVILLILSIILIIRGVKGTRQSGDIAESATFSGEKKKQTVIEYLSESKEIWLTFLFLGIYIALLKPVGFLLMTIIYIFAESMLLSKREERNWKLSLGLAVFCAVLIDYIFIRVFFILLPHGILGF